MLQREEDITALQKDQTAKQNAKHWKPYSQNSIRQCVQQVIIIGRSEIGVKFTVHAGRVGHGGRSRLSEVKKFILLSLRRKKEDKLILKRWKIWKVSVGRWNFILISRLKKEENLASETAR